jgi:hypothetical protein
MFVLISAILCFVYKQSAVCHCRAGDRVAAKDCTMSALNTQNGKWDLSPSEAEQRAHI